MGLCKGGMITRIGDVYQAPDGRPGSTFAVGATLENGIKVVVKNVSGIRLANEIAAAWVAKQIGLARVAEVRLVDDQEGLLKDIYNGFAGKCFASVFSALPEFQQPDCYGSLEITKREEFREIIVFDTLIANADRQNRNLRWSATDACIFDHDQAFTGKAWSPVSLSSAVAATPQSGMFEALLDFADQNARAEIMLLANSWTKAISDTVAQELDELMQLSGIDQAHVDALKGFIVTRSANLPCLVQKVLDRHQPIN